MPPLSYLRDSLRFGRLHLRWSGAAARPFRSVVRNRSFAWELLRSPSASPERSLPKQNYFFISKIENYRKSFIHADLPLFCTFPKFFPKSKIGRQILPQIFQNEFFQYRPILAVKFLTASRVCVAKVGAGIKKEPPLREALGEISFAVMFLHKESFGSSTSLMPYK